MSNKKNNIHKLVVAVIIASIFLLIFLSSWSVSAEYWIGLNGTGEIRINDSNSLDGFSQATWNMWVNQEEYVNNAGIVGKYVAQTGKRSYLIRTSNVNGISIVISQDGTNVGTYSSALSRECGIRENNEWTMITVTYNGPLIKYYRNGVLCDQDTTTIISIYNSSSPLSFGGGNNLFFRGRIDESTFYNKLLNREQIIRLYNESVHGSALGQSIPVLVYHKVEDSANNTITVSLDQFEAQMNYLKKNGFKTVSLRHYSNWRKGTYTMPKKSVILVFDDGFKSVYENAKPIMSQYWFVGSIAAVTRYASFSENNSGYMTWTQIKALSDQGWSIESHGVTHSRLLALNESQFREELFSSKQSIINKTGRTSPSFVFPFHESNETYTHICGEYYDLCWTQGSLNPSYDFKSTPGKEYLSLRRISIVNFTTLEDFANYLGRDTNKLGEWIMEEGSGNITVDSSGNKNNGALLNGASWFSEDIYLATSKNASENDIQIKDKDKEKDKNKTKASPGHLDDDIDNIVDSDEGKAPMKLDEEKIWPDNMDIEGDYYSNYNPEI